MASPEKKASQPQSNQDFKQAPAVERKRNLVTQAQLLSQIQTLTAKVAVRNIKIHSLESTIVNLSKAVKEAQQQKEGLLLVAQSIDGAGSNSDKILPAKRKLADNVDGAGSYSDKKVPAKRKSARPPKHKSEPKQEEVLTKRLIQWNKRFDELVAYKETHGHCNVSNGSGSFHALGLWVYSQRLKQKQMMEEGKECGLGLEQIRRLRSIGFLFQKPPTGQLPFDQRLKQLIDFKAKIGHCNVPHTCSDCPKGLPNFVQDLRKYYRQRQAGKKCSLTQQRIDQLNAIDFRWSLRDTLDEYQQKQI